MSASEQLEFQKYNQSLGGKPSPISMEQLKSKAQEIYDREVARQEGENDYGGFASISADEEEESSSTPGDEPETTPIESVAAPDKKRKRASKSKTLYNVYDNGSRVFQTEKQKEAWAFVAGSDKTVEEVKTTILEGPPKPRKKRIVVPPKTLKLLGFINHRDVRFGNFQCLMGGLDATGKRPTWWIDNSVALDGSDTNEVIRNCASMIRRIPASTITEWVEKKYSLPNEMNTWPLFVQTDSDRQKIGAVAAKIRKCIVNADNI